MKYTSRFIQEILKSPAAKRGLDYITPIYENAFVALWLMQAIGIQTDLLIQWVEEYKAQILPQTATWSLPLWEAEYGLQGGDALSDGERRKRLLTTIRGRAPMNPKKLAGLLTVVADAKEEIVIQENTGKNRFSVETGEAFTHGQVLKMRPVLDEYKPAHLIYWFNTMTKGRIANQYHLDLYKTAFLCRGKNLEYQSLDGSFVLDGSRVLLGGVDRRAAVEFLLSGRSYERPAHLTINGKWRLDGSFLLGGKKRFTEVLLEGEKPLDGCFLLDMKESPEDVGWASSTGCSLIIDRRWYLNGACGLNGGKKLNAGIVRLAV